MLTVTKMLYTTNMTRGADERLNAGERVVRVGELLRCVRTGEDHRVPQDQMQNVKEKTTMNIQKVLIASDYGSSGNMVRGRRKNSHTKAAVRRAVKKAARRRMADRGDC